MLAGLERVQVREGTAEWRCRLPHCGGWLESGNLCAFHTRLHARQLGNPFHYDVENTEADEARALYAQHVQRARAEIPYHLLMASLWPGIHLEKRHRERKRNAAQQARWNEENDR